MTTRFRRRGAAALLFLLVLLCGACSDGTSGGPGDGGPVGDGPPHDLNTIQVTGTATLGISSPATGVKVTWRCGQKSGSATTNDQGSYTFTADVKGCTPLVVEFNKQSYLPNIRVVHLPPPTSPITLDVPLSALEKLQCGSHRCKVENNSLWNLPNKPMKQGWVVSMAGTSALDYLAGEFRQKDGDLAALLGFAFFDFRDQAGATIKSFQSADVIDLCVPVPSTSLDWIGDVSAAAERVELNWYNLDPQRGRWAARTKMAQVSYTRGYKYKKDKNGQCVQELDAEGQPIRNIVTAKRSELADIRSGQLMFSDECAGGIKTQVYEYWVCGAVDGSGWYAWGLAAKERACFALQATDQCKTPLANAVFVLRGRDHGYRTEAWTDYRGKACVEVFPSEPTGKDYDYDRLAGETFWVDVEVSYAKVLQSFIKSHESPKFSATMSSGCQKRTDCIPLNKTITDYTKGSCP